MEYCILTRLIKFLFHHDALSSHTATFTQRYAAETQQKYDITTIPNEDIPGQSPDTSLMDFFGFGYLKQKIIKQRATTIPALWKVLNEERNKVSPEIGPKVFYEWKQRCRLVTKVSGEHIENIKNIHKRRL